MCTYDNTASCELAMNSKGTTQGSLLAGIFEYTGDVTTDEYKDYKSDVQTGGDRYWDAAFPKGDFWTCNDPGKRRKRALTLDEMRLLEEINTLEPEVYVETMSPSGEVERTYFSSESATPSSYTSSNQEVTEQESTPEQEQTESWIAEEQTASPHAGPSYDTSTPEFVKNWNWSEEQPVVNITEMIMGTVLVLCFLTSLVLVFLGAKRYLRRAEEEEKQADYPKKPSAYNLFE